MRPPLPGRLWQGSRCVAHAEMSFFFPPALCPFQSSSPCVPSSYPRRYVYATMPSGTDTMVKRDAADDSRRHLHSCLFFESLERPFVLFCSLSVWLSGHAPCVLGAFVSDTVAQTDPHGLAACGTYRDQYVRIHDHSKLRDSLFLIY